MKIFQNCLTLILLVTISFLTLKVDTDNKTVFINKTSISNEKEEANGAIDWLNRRRVNLQTGKIDFNDIIKAQDEVASFQNLKNTNSLGLSWIEMGPNNIGGRTRALLIDNVDNNLMFAGGVSGGLWKSANAGATWSIVTNGDFWDNINIASICQASNGDIYVGTGEGLYYNSGYGTGGLAGSGIWKSTNHGQTFNKLTSTWSNDSINGYAVKNIFSNVNRIASDPTDNNLIYASTNKGLMASNDGGSSWYNPVIEKYIAGNPIFINSTSTDVKVANDGSVIASIGNKAYLADGKIFNNNIESISLSDNDLVVVVGKNGKVLKSINSGNSWTSVTSGIYTHIYSYSQAGVSTGFAVGNSGKIYKTNNAGNSWQTLTSGTTNQLESVCFVSAVTGFAVGYIGTILKTTNTGQTWTTLSSGTTENLHSIDFATTPVGYLVGDAGKIKKTSNAGTSWTNSTSSTTKNLYSVNCISSSKIIAVGDSGTVVRTTNGGTSWTTINSGTQQNLKSVFFITDSIGFIVGTNGIILKSQDIGLTWSTIYSGTSANFNNIYFKGDVGYIVGDAGTILKSIDGGITWSSLTSGVSVNLHAIYFNNYIKVKTQSPHNLSSNDIISLITEINSYNHSGTIYSIVSSDEFIIDIPYYVDYFNIIGHISNLINLDEKQSLSPNAGRLEFAFSPSNSDYIYCSAAKNTGELENIYQSKNKGITWNVIGSGDDPLFDPFYHQGIYNNSIAVYPNNSESTLLGGIDLWKREQGGIFEQISIWNNASNSSYVHADIHQLVFHPSYSTNNTFFIGTDGGIFKSINSGSSYSKLNNNYNVTQFYSVAASPQGAVIGGTQDNGTQYISSSVISPASAIEISGGDGGYSFCSALNPNVFFSSIYYGTIFRSQNKGASMSTYFSGNSGGNFVTPFRVWESFNDSLSADSAIYTYPIGSPILFSGQILNVVANSKINNRPINCNYTIKNNDTLYPGETIKVQDYYQAMFALGMTNGIYISRTPLDFTSYSLINSATNISGMVETLEFSKDGNYLYIATPNRIYRIGNLLNARTNSQLQNLSADVIGIFGSQTITSLAVDPQNPENLIVTLGNYGNTNYVYYCTNAATCPVSTGLSNFTLAQGNLPEMPVYSSLIFWNDSKTVIIGTEYGVFSTIDITASSVEWDKETAFPNVAIYMLTQQLFENKWDNGVTNHGYIYAATHGRGLWRSESNSGPLAVKENQKFSESNSFNIYPNPAYNITYIEYVSSLVSYCIINLFNSNGTLVKQLNYKLLTGNNKIELDVTSFPKGIYYVSIKTEQKTIAKRLIVN